MINKKHNKQNIACIALLLLGIHARLSTAGGLTGSDALIAVSAQQAGQQERNAQSVLDFCIAVLKDLPDHIPHENHDEGQINVRKWFLNAFLEKVKTACAQVEAQNITVTAVTVLPNRSDEYVHHTDVFIQTDRIMIHVLQYPWSLKMTWTLLGLAQDKVPQVHLAWFTAQAKSDRHADYMESSVNDNLTDRIDLIPIPFQEVDFTKLPLMSAQMSSSSGG